MELKGKDFYIISRIKNDGTGVVLYDDRMRDEFNKNPLFSETTYKLSRISPTFDTYLASNMSFYVVKLLNKK